MAMCWWAGCVDMGLGGCKGFGGEKVAGKGDGVGGWGFV